MVERFGQAIGFARDAVAELAVVWEQVPVGERRPLVLEHYLHSMSSHCAAVLGEGRVEHLRVVATRIIGISILTSHITIYMPQDNMPVLLNCPHYEPPLSTVTCRRAPGRKAG